MAIDVEFIAHFRLITGVHKLSLDVEDVSIMDVIELLGRKYGSRFLDEILVKGELMEDILFLKNGDLINNDKEKLKDGDVLSLIPPAFGG
ncbi:MAG: MoaD family protein [Candidatus Methanofastidiosa archaeon]|nr:MoaD family protein [Candidatus Methanofastidiosa archaeon]